MNIRLKENKYVHNANHFYESVFFTRYKPNSLNTLQRPNGPNHSPPTA
jgi:hypothetical protein